MAKPLRKLLNDFLGMTDEEIMERGGNGVAYMMTPPETALKHEDLRVRKELSTAFRTSELEVLEERAKEGKERSMEKLPKVANSVSEVSGDADTNKVTFTLKEFHEVHEKIQKDKRATVTDPNGMRPGKWTVETNGVFIHALDGSGGYDFDIYVTKRDASVYTIWFDPSNILYHASHYYEKEDTEVGFCDLKWVSRLLDEELKYPEDWPFFKFTPIEDISDMMK